MFDRERKIYAFQKQYCRQLVADIDDASFADQPSPGVNPPAWLIGHLAVVADLTVELLGGASELSAWRADFGPGSTPRNDRASYPPKAELMAAYETAHDRLEAAARDADPERADRRHPLRLELIQRTLPTIGDLTAHVMTSHEGAHIGHLSNWRRQMGLPYLF